MSESWINDGIPDRKCANGTIKSDIALHEKNNYNKNTDEDSNNLSTTPINNCKTTTSENNIIRTTETTDNNNDVINDDLAARTLRKKFPTNTTTYHLSLVRLKPNLINENTPLK